MLVSLVLLAKLALYGSALFSMGLALHWSLRINDEIVPYKRGLLVMAAIFMAAIIVRLLLANAQLGSGLTDAFAASTFKWIWRPHALQTYAFFTGMALLLFGVFTNRRQLTLGAVLLVCLGFGLAGHTQSLGMRYLWSAFIAVHVAIAAFWLAAPITLWPRKDQKQALLTGQVQRFSRIARWLVPIVFITGLIVLWRLVGGPGEVIASLYGRLLLAKLVLATGLLAIGAYNKEIVTRQLEASWKKGKILLRRTLQAEAVLFALVLIVITLATSITGPES